MIRPRLFLARFAPGLLGLWLLGAPSLVSAQGGPYVLQTFPDVRAEGMGRGSLAINEDVLGLWGNVASVAWGLGTEIAGSRAQLVPDLAEDVFANYVVGRQRLDVGNARVGLAGEFGDLSYSGFYERFPGGAAGVRFPVGGRGWVGVGAGVKWVDVDGTYSGGSPIGYPVHVSGTAWDLGLLAGVPDSDDATTGDWNGMAGLSVHNLGGDIRTEGEEQGDPLPRTFRAGAGVGRTFGRRPPDPNASSFALVAPRAVARVRLNGTVEQNLVDEEGAPPDSTFQPSWFDEHKVVVNVGAEVLWFDAVALRAGYIHDDPGEIKGYTWGLGVRITQYVQLDFADIPQFEELDRVQKWGLTLRTPFPGSRLGTLGLTLAPGPGTKDFHVPAWSQAVRIACATAAPDGYTGARIDGR